MLSPTSEVLKSMIAFLSQTLGGTKVGYSCEYTEHSLFLYCYLWIIVLFSIWTTVNLLLPRPVYWALTHLHAIYKSIAWKDPWVLEVWVLWLVICEHEDTKKPWKT